MAVHKSLLIDIFYDSVPRRNAFKYVCISMEEKLLFIDIQIHEEILYHIP